MRKLALILCMSLILACTACSGSGTQSDNGSSGSSVERVETTETEKPVGKIEFTDYSKYKWGVLPDGTPATEDDFNNLPKLALSRKVVQDTGLALDGELEIPMYIEWSDTLYRVESIIEHAFSNSDIRGVFIPEGVVEIRDNAFTDCDELEWVSFPSTLEVIGYSAFFNCTSLKSVVIPESVIEIGADAFSKCTNLETVTFNNESVEIANSTFDKTKFIDEYLSTNNLFVLGNTVWDASPDLTYIDIPEGITRIADFAFSGCSLLEDFSLPSSLKRCGFAAFRDTRWWYDNLPSDYDYVIKDGVLIYRNYYGDWSEFNNENLYKDGIITVPDGTRVIGDSFFRELPHGTAGIIIPDGVEYIGDECFFEKVSVTNLSDFKVDLPSTLKGIGCSSLKYLVECSGGQFPELESICFIDTPHA